ncbi:hypothetical protein DAPPUDRAFT_324874 [Daphnia pulex]|uniref:Tc1-like transposase DDE domain-containing protein n=1 Tax=Daphnia pulex TaxID=6669 RepID=E9H303_DAPPU|nr:hypothetical protein DAPPUDRAFT_324874 [Daphnia pulex]|eukprot:EFX73922.1 hypothetical protein DAPPUDRAFT_324874 [Daphnia pulex]
MSVAVRSLFEQTEPDLFQDIHFPSSGVAGSRYPYGDGFLSMGRGLSIISMDVSLQKNISVLEDHLVPSAWARFGATADDPVPFVQDKSSIHMSHIVMDWFEDEGKEFELLPWPPKGADFNPIENIWSEMTRSMDAQQVANGDQLWNFS